VTDGGLARFSGFADVYDANRPSPPAELGPLLAAYAGTPHPVVADLGCGTGLSSRWASAWAASVTGIEPNPDMRAMAASRPAPNVDYRPGRAEDTGLEPGGFDVVTAVQAMHWFEPGATLAEVGRLLRPGGVLAVIDADWPPVSGLVRAELAWTEMHRRIRALEARVSRGESPAAVLAPVKADDPDVVDDDLADPHRNRRLPGGVRSWSKSGHLARMAASGMFRFTREVLTSRAVDGGADRFKALMYSQGSYQGLRRHGLSDSDIGADRFEAEVDAAYAAAGDPPGLAFSWRVRLGVR